MANKTVTVTIIPTVDGPKRTIAISVNPDPVVLDDTFVGIDWEIAGSPNWTFTRDNHGNSTGIDIKKHRGRFKDPGGHGDPKKHGWGRLQKDGLYYTYTVSVTNETMETDAAQLATLTWDPLIHNN